MSVTRGRGSELVAANTRVDENDSRQRLYGHVQSEVLKDYLPHVATHFHALSPAGDLDPSEAVATFDVTKLVLSDDEHSLEKLKNVYHLLADSASSLALIVHRTAAACRLTMAVGIDRNDSEAVRRLTMSVRDAMLGNFPGSEFGAVQFHSASDGGAFAPLDARTHFREGSFSSVAIVSNVASDFGESFSTQGIETLLDGVRLEEDEEFTLMLVGEAMPAGNLSIVRERLHTLYTALSPFERVQYAWGEQESKSWSAGVSAGTFLPGVLARVPVPVLSSMTPNLGLNVSRSSTRGTMSSTSATVTEFGVTQILQRIRKQVERLDESEALGHWSFAAYVLSPDLRLVSEAAHMYMSLTQGNGSSVERPSINIWNANALGGSRRDEIEAIRASLMVLRHPEFEKDTERSESVFNQINWPELVTCTAALSGSELTRAMNIPRRSIPGVPVIECASFGREVSSYDPSLDGDLRLGVIHHMHADEAMPVMLSSESLASHVLVTGSTGAGKTNAVASLLARSSVPFLVVEPAKGEYRELFGDDVPVLGTNPRKGPVLHVNPFAFRDGVHVFEHIDRVLEIFNVAWPMYAAMPAVLKAAVTHAYEHAGWNLQISHNPLGRIFPTVADVCAEVDAYIGSSSYSNDTQGDYRGALKTRLDSLTNGLNGLIFCNGDVGDETLFERSMIVDLSRVGSTEVKALVMGVLVIRLQEHRMEQGARNVPLRHLTVLEEAHTILRDSFATGAGDGGSLAAKGVEMLANAIAEMRSYGEGFVIADQSPTVLDRSVIRNTNTKVILRLPDGSDRELAGRSAALDDAQIVELSRLQRGVAAVYQNEWTGPVLCHVDRYVPAGPSRRVERAEVRANELPHRRGTDPLLARCLFDPRLIAKEGVEQLTEAVRRSTLSGTDAANLLAIAHTGGFTSRELYEQLAYDYFDIGAVLGETQGMDGDRFRKVLVRYLADEFGLILDQGDRDQDERLEWFIAWMMEHHLRLAARSGAEASERELERIRGISLSASRKA